MPPLVEAGGKHKTSSFEGRILVSGFVQDLFPDGIQGIVRNVLSACFGIQTALPEMLQCLNRPNVGGDKLPMHHHGNKIIATLNRFEYRPKGIVKPTGIGLIEV